MNQNLAYWLAEYQMKAMSHLSRRWFYEQCKMLDRTATFLGLTRRPFDVFQADIEALYRFLKDERGLADSTIKKYRCVGRDWFNYIVAREGAEVNPFKRPSHPKNKWQLAVEAGVKL